MRIFVSVTVTILALGLAACGGDSVDGCDFRAEDDRCQERVRSVSDPVGAASSGFKATCEAAGGVALDDGCPTDGRVAGCVLDGGGGAEEVTDWFYAPATRADVEMACAGDGTVVDP